MWRKALPSNAVGHADAARRQPVARPHQYSACPVRRIREVAFWIGWNMMMMLAHYAADEVHCVASLVVVPQLDPTHVPDAITETLQ